VVVIIIIIMIAVKGRAGRLRRLGGKWAVAAEAHDAPAMHVLSIRDAVLTVSPISL